MWFSMKYTLDWITKQNPWPTVAAFYSTFKNVTFQTYSGPQRIPLQAPLYSPALWTHANMSAHLLHSLFLKEVQCYRYVRICAIFPFPPLKPQHPPGKEAPGHQTQDTGRGEPGRPPSPQRGAARTRQGATPTRFIRHFNTKAFTTNHSTNAKYPSWNHLSNSKNTFQQRKVVNPLRTDELAECSRHLFCSQERELFKGVLRPSMQVTGGLRRGGGDDREHTSALTNWHASTTTRAPAETRTLTDSPRGESGSLVGLDSDASSQG